MDAIALLKKDHAKVSELFTRFNDGGGLTGMVKRLTGNTASPRQRRSTAEQVCGELDVHAAIEEATFYPAVRALHDERLDQLLDESLREHGSIKDRVGEVRASLGGDEPLRTAMASLQECVEHHVHEEENEMFPLLEQRMPAAERQRLGRTLAAGKRGTARAAGRTTARARRRKTVKRAAARTGAAGRRVRKGAAKAKKARATTKARAARRR